MSQKMPPQSFNRPAKAQTRARQYANEQVPLSTYIAQGAGGMVFMLFILWLAGFGS
jgi:hypothetical protein